VCVWGGKLKGVALVLYMLRVCARYGNYGYMCDMSFNHDALSEASHILTEPSGLRAETSTGKIR
jgi:hypothetical protein